MYKTQAETYEQLLLRYSAIVERSVKERFNKARDKDSIAQEITNETAYMDGLMTATSEAKELLNDFLHLYDKGDSIDAILDSIKGRYGINTEAFKSHIDDKGELQIVHPTDEAARVALLAADKRKLLKFLVRYMAVQQLKRKLPVILKPEPKHPENKPVALYPVQWTGSKDNKNEFVQLIYALHEAGYLNNGTGEITKIVESLAETLKVGLGKSWQSNLSSSIHKSKKDYEPPVFEKIRQAYLKYADDLIMAKKTNR